MHVGEAEAPCPRCRQALRCDNEHAQDCGQRFSASNWRLLTAPALRARVRLDALRNEDFVRISGVSGLMESLARFVNGRGSSAHVGHG